MKELEDRIQNLRNKHLDLHKQIKSLWNIHDIEDKKMNEAIYLLLEEEKKGYIIQNPNIRYYINGQKSHQYRAKMNKHVDMWHEAQISLILELIELLPEDSEITKKAKHHLDDVKSHRNH